MFNSKFINIGAFILFGYCLYQYGTFGKIFSQGNNLHTVTNAKYKVNWNMDGDKKKQTSVDRVLNYIFADKISAIKKYNQSTERLTNNLPSAKIGDIVDVYYNLSEKGNILKKEELKEFTLAKNHELTKFIEDMKVGETKVIYLHKGDVTDKILPMKDNGGEVKLEINLISLQKR